MTAGNGRKRKTVQQIADDEAAALAKKAEAARKRRAKARAARANS